MKPTSTASIVQANVVYTNHSTLRRRALVSISVTLGILVAYMYRQVMSVDGVSYLDVASAYLRHDWALAINGYWSPLYSWLLAIFLGVLPHSARTEYSVVHVVNLLCYLFALYGFHKFWTEFGSYVGEDSADNASTLPELSPGLWDVLGYSLFLYLFLQLISIATPDVLSSGFIFLAMQRAMRWKGGHEHSLSEAFVLALILALGYLTKAILLYFGFFVLAALFIQGRERKLRPLLVAGILFLTMVMPWAFVLRSAYGQFTFGFSGKLNYSWFVNGTEAGELLAPSGTNIPYFPGPKIFHDPATYATKIVPHVTYWPWFDPARFGKPRAAQLNIVRQLKTLLKNVVWLRSWFLVEFGAITFSVLALWIAAGWAGIRNVLREWVLWGPIVLVLGMYGLVFIRSFRYIAAFTVILFGLALGAVRIPRAYVRVIRSIVTAGICMFALINYPGTLKGMVQNARRAKVNVAVAEELNSSGIHRGDVVGVVEEEDYLYWARLTGVSVGGEVWPKDVQKFWGASKDIQFQVVCAMQRNGAKAVVGRPPDGTHPAGWSELGKTGYFRFTGTLNDCR